MGAFGKAMKVWSQSSIRSLAWVVVVAAALCMPTAPKAAVAEFFWAGFYVADAGIDKKSNESYLYKTFDTPYRSARTGAARSLLAGLKWDAFAYYENASERSHVHENLNDLYGVFISVDKVLQFAPDVLDIGGVKKSHFHTYVFATLNIFAADTRNLIYSHPFFLTDTSTAKRALHSVFKATLGQLADRLKDPSNGFTAQIRAGVQSYFGGPGVSKEAIRRTQKPIHIADSSSDDTFGVNGVCGECVDVMDQSNRTVVSTKAMGDFARFFLSAKLARYKQVAFLPEQRTIVQERTGDAAATAKEGDIDRSFDEVCVPSYDKTGRSTICVKVRPPRNPIWIGIRAMVKPQTTAARMQELRYMTIVDLEAELVGRKEAFVGDLSSQYDVSVVKGQKVSDVYYINGIIKAIENLDQNTFR